jgi:hypothetical protein
MKKDTTPAAKKAAKKPSGEDAGAPKPASVREAEAEVAAMTPATAPKGISEEEIKAKTQVGLTRDQAIEVIERQRAEDAATKPKG